MAVREFLKPEYIQKEFDERVKAARAKGRATTAEEYAAEDRAREARQEFVRDSLDQSQKDFMGWMTNPSKNKKYGYDFSNPEDTKRFETGKVSLAYEKTYTDDPFDQWLKAHGQASQKYFLETYYPNAQQTVTRNRYVQNAYNDFKNEVGKKLWDNPNTAKKAITKDDVSLAISDVFLSDREGKYKVVRDNFSNTFAKKLEDFRDDATFSAEAKYKLYLAEQKDKRGAMFSAQDLMDDYTERAYSLVDAAARDAERERAEKQAKSDRLDAALRGIKEKDLAGQGRRYVGTVNPTPTRATEVSQAAADKAHNLLAAQGLREGEIAEVMRRNGFEYEKTSKGQAVRAAEKKADAELSKKLKGWISSRGLEKDIAYLTYSDPRRMAGPNTPILPDPERRRAAEAKVSGEVAAWRQSMIDAGYSPLAADNAVRRESRGLEEMIPNRVIAEDLQRDVLGKHYALTDAEIDGILADYSEDEWRQIESDLKYSRGVDVSAATQTERSIASIPVRAALSIVNSAVALADMTADVFDGKERLPWEATQRLAEWSEKLRNYGTGEHYKVLSGVSDLGSEILRMYVTAGIGGGLSKAVSASAAGFGKFLSAAASGVKSAPFIAGAIGTYYSEARMNGADAKDAAPYALVCGVVEGLTEKLAMSEVLTQAVSKRAAAKLTGKGIQAFAWKYGLTAASVLCSAAGEFAEEALSEIASTAMQRATWNPDAQWDVGQIMDAGGMGALMGLVMAGISAPAGSRRYSLALSILADNNSTARQKLLARGLIDADGRTFGEKLDSLVAASYAESITDSARAAMLANGAAVLDHDAYVKTRETIDDCKDQMAAEQERYEQRMSKLDADEAKQKAKVEALERRIAGIDVSNAANAKRYAELLSQLNAAEANLDQIAESTAAQRAAAEKEHEKITAGLANTLRENTQLINRHYVARYAQDFPDGPESPKKARDAKEAEITLMEDKWAHSDINKPTEGVAQQDDNGYTKSGGDIDGREAGSAAESGGTSERFAPLQTSDAGRSGILVPDRRPILQEVPPDVSGRGQEQGGHRGVRSALRIINEQRIALSMAGVPDLGLNISDDHAGFCQALDEAKATAKHGAAVDSKSEADLEGAVTLINDDRSATVAVMPDGDVTAVAKNYDKCHVKGAGKDLIISAVAAGGKKLDCYGRNLVNTYVPGGMVPVARIKYTHGINTAMDAIVDARIAAGEISQPPDLYFMMLDGGYDVNRAAEYAAKASPYTQAELDALPLIEGTEDDYTAAQNYRDGLLMEQEAAATENTAQTQDSAGGTEGPVEHAVSPELMESTKGVRKWFRNVYTDWITGFATGERAAKVQANLNRGAVTVDEMAQILRNSGGTVDYILEGSLVDRNRTDMGVGAFADVMDYPEPVKGLVQEYALNLHNIDRMSLETAARPLVEQAQAEADSFIQAHPELAQISIDDAAGMKRSGRSAIAEYARLAYNLKQAQSVKDKPVMRNDDGSVRTAEQSLQIVREMEKEHPELEAWRARKTRWWDTFGREWLVNSGLLSEEDWAAWHDMYKNYVPTKREKYADKRDSTSSIYNNTASTGGKIHKATGATSEVVDIRDSMADYVNTIVRASAKNDVLVNLYQFAQQHPNAASEFVQIVDEDKNPLFPDLELDNPFDALAAEAFAEAADGRYVLRCKIGGKWKYMTASRDMFDAVADLFGRKYNAGTERLINAGRKMTGWKKALITGANPFFAIRNTFRDVQTAYINDESANPVPFLRSYIEAIRDMAADSEDYRRFKAYGGDRTGFFKASEGFVKSAGLDANTGSKAAQAAKKAAMWVPDLFAKMGGASETVGRYATAKRYLERHGKSDANWKKAMLASAEGTTNFSRSGASGKAVDAFCLYLNANLQGLDKLARQYANHTGKTVGKTLGIAAASILVHFLTDNDDNEHYHNLSSFVKDGNYCIPNPFGPRDENGYCTTFIAIPKAQGYGAIIAGFERLAPLIEGDKNFDEAYSHFYDAVTSALPVNPTMPWSSVAQAARNKNWYGADIEPKRMEGEPIEERYEYKTSAIAVNLSRLLAAMGIEASPMKINYVLDQESGVIGDIVLPVTAVQNIDDYGTENQSFNPASAAKSLTEPIKHQFVKDPLFSTDTTGDFYDAYDAAKTAADRAKNERMDARISEQSDAEKLFKKYSDMSWWLTASFKKERGILNSEPNTKERDGRVKAIREERIKILQGFMADPAAYKVPKK